MSNDELTLDDIETYRLERGLSVAAIAKEVGVSIDVYKTNVTGRMMHGNFIKTKPYKQNEIRFTRFLKRNDAEIRAAIQESRLTA